MGNELIEVEGTSVEVIKQGGGSYVSLTDMAKYSNSRAPGAIIQNWLRTRYTVEYLGVWESVNNKNFNILDFEYIRNESGSNSFVLSVSDWVEKTNAIGIFSKLGRYGGTYAHRDIAFEFATWLSPRYKYFLIHEFERLKEEEYRQKSLEWNLSRTLAKINYKIQTDAVLEYLIPPEVTQKQANREYASEGDALNIALFGTTAKEWREKYPERAKEGNMRDFATLEQLIALTNLESLNAVMIADGLPQSDRIIRMNTTARTQLKSLFADDRVRKLQNLSPRKLLEK
jgi:hypothetical protein